ncbi:MAG: murein L,D-transpeptidase catalytic domain family protein [Flavobacterium sp.]|nr:murein L,D-transpeptidase catalytic domain family protein [Flavobacterium sp.]
MNYNFLAYLLSFSLSFTSNTKILTNPIFLAKTVEVSVEKKVDFIYSELHTRKFAVPKLECFSEALNGFYNLKSKGIITKNILTLIDFSLPSSSKRLWVIDLVTNTILYNTVVSHGINSGGDFATSFSNLQSSNKSSLGFYATGESYIGKNGFSLKLDGLEKGVNSNARARAVVIHGAYYANPSILNSQSYLGRSQGCPALPENLSKEIINIIKGKSCLFIYHPSRFPKLGNALIS